MPQIEARAKYASRNLNENRLRCDRLRDRNLLDAAHVPDLPVAPLAFRVAVVTGHARRPHHHRRDQSDAVAEQRPGGLDQPLVGILAQGFKRRSLEIVQNVRRAVREGDIRDKAVLDVLLLLADDMPELERQRGRNRDRPANRLIIVHDLGRSRIGQDPADDIRPVVAAHARDHRVEIGGLPPQGGVGENRQVKPDRYRQCGKQRANCASDHQAAATQPGQIVRCHRVFFLFDPAHPKIERRVTDRRKQNRRRLASPSFKSCFPRHRTRPRGVRDGWRRD